MSTHEKQPRLTLPASHRLRRQADFDRVYQCRTAKAAGPLRVHGLPNGLVHCRVGLSVSRRVGNAVVRNGVKRRLREAFRLCQHDLPGGYDLVVVVRPHTMMKTADYLRLLIQTVQRLHKHWSGRVGPRESVKGTGESKAGSAEEPGRC